MKCAKCGELIPDGVGHYQWINDDISVCCECRDKEGDNYWKLAEEIRRERCQDNAHAAGT